MPVVSLEEYRRLLALCGDRDVALDVASLSEQRAQALAAHLNWTAQCARVLYDAQARQLRRYDLDPTTVLGPRP